MKYLLIIAIIAMVLQSCATTPPGMYRGAGESRNCHAWRMAAMRTNGPIQ